MNVSQVNHTRGISEFTISEEVPHEAEDQRSLPRRTNLDSQITKRKTRAISNKFHSHLTPDGVESSRQHGLSGVERGSEIFYSFTHND